MRGGGAVIRGGGGGGAIRVTWGCGRAAGGGAARLISGLICGCGAGRIAGVTGPDCVTGGVSFSCTAGFAAGCTLACDGEGGASLVAPGFAGAVLAVFAGLAVVACSGTLGCPAVGVVVWGVSLVLAGCETPGLATPGVEVSAGLLGVAVFEPGP